MVTGQSGKLSSLLYIRKGKGTIITHKVGLNNPSKVRKGGETRVRLGSAEHCCCKQPLLHLPSHASAQLGGPHSELGDENTSRLRVFLFLRPEQFPYLLYSVELCYTTAGASRRACSSHTAGDCLRFNSSCLLRRRSKEKEKCCERSHFHTACFCSPSNPAHTELSHFLLATHPPMLLSGLFQSKTLK